MIRKIACAAVSGLSICGGNDVWEFHDYANRELKVNRKLKMNQELNANQELKVGVVASPGS